MLSELFGPPSHIELEDLDEPDRKKARTEAAAFEEEVFKQEGIPDTSQTKTVYPTSMSMSHTFWKTTSLLHTRLKNAANQLDKW